jgi:hypothetical protein
VTSRISRARSEIGRSTDVSQGPPRSDSRMRIEIEVSQVAGEAIGGTISAEEAVTPFEGWMELLQVLDRLIRPG